MTKSQAEANAVHRLVRTNYAIRTGAFAWSFLVIGLYGWGKGLGIDFWLLLGLQFLVYPHYVYHRARLAENPKRTEISNLYLDAGLLGMWVAGLGFPIWIGYAVLHATSLNAIVLRGMRGLASSLGAFCLGAGFLVAGREVQYTPATGELITALCFLGSLAYTCAIGYVEFAQNRRLVAAREALRHGEARYRLITENAADLVAMVDVDGRWLYASPSYERVLAAADLEPGVGVFRRAHPDDAETAMLALRRVAITGKARELTVRLVGKDGRFRQYLTRVQPVEPESADEKPPRAPNYTRLLLVSRDVTDLRESEERVLVAAHALEGMTEAIVITSADGTILTVNQAFSQLTGHSRDDVLGRAEKEVRHALQPAAFYDEVYLAVQRNGFWTGTTWSKRKNGSVYREWRSVRSVKSEQGAVTHYVMVFYEVGAPRRNGALGNGASPTET
jgi:PAS domain S-box-containing protein